MRAGRSEPTERRLPRRELGVRWRRMGSPSRYRRSASSSVSGGESGPEKCRPGDALSPAGWHYARKGRVVPCPQPTPSAHVVRPAGPGWRKVPSLAWRCRRGREDHSRNGQDVLVYLIPFIRLRWILLPSVTAAGTSGSMFCDLVQGREAAQQTGTATNVGRGGHFSTLARFGQGRRC